MSDKITLANRTFACDKVREHLRRLQNGKHYKPQNEMLECFLVLLKNLCCDSIVYGWIGDKYCMQYIKE